MNPSVYRNRQKNNIIMKELQKQREQGTFCDVLLEAAGQQYWAHSCVLAAHSKKLGTAVENGKSKFGSKGVIKMKLPTSKPVVVEAILKYMYDSHLTVTYDTVEDFIQLATKLEMDGVKQCCAIHLARNVTSQNWMDVKKMGEAHNLEEISKAIHEHCVQNFCDVVHEPEFLQFDLEALENILKEANPRNAPRLELHRLYAILKWTCHGFPKRMSSYENLVGMLNTSVLDLDKSLALFEEETVKASNILNDVHSLSLFQKISEPKQKTVVTNNTEATG